jgi:hypothetical protein
MPTSVMGLHMSRNYTQRPMCTSIVCTGPPVIEGLEASLETLGRSRKSCTDCKVVQQSKGCTSRNAIISGHAARPAF